jgi:alpha-tubulin suppressor-like RCC1 family protein
VSGNESYCAVLASGGVDCWGIDENGQLGNGTIYGTDGVQGFDSPQVASGITNATSVASEGGKGYCALLATGSVDCWGDNEAGEIGNGTINGPDGPYVYDTPQPVSGLTNGTSILSDGTGYCAVLATGGLDCWGDNGAGQLGNGTTGGPDNADGYDSPQTVTAVTNATAVSSATNSYCAVLATGGVDCWGDNETGQLGNGSIGGPEGENGSNGYDTPQAVLATGSVDSEAASLKSEAGRAIAPKAKSSDRHLRRSHILSPSPTAPYLKTDS